MKLPEQTMDTLEPPRQPRKRRSTEAMRENDSSRKLTSVQLSVKDGPAIMGASQLQRTEGAGFQDYMTQSEATGPSPTPIPVEDAMDYARDPTASRQEGPVKSVLDTQQLACSVRNRQMKPGSERVEKSVKMVRRSFCCSCCEFLPIKNSVDCRGCGHELCPECVLAATAAHAVKGLRDATKTRECT
jgi:hypothetical protein